MSDIGRLVERARDGDQNAFEEIVRRFQDMAYGYAYSTLGDFGEAQDVTQEAFVQAFRGLGGLREPGAFAGWLRRIVQTFCHRRLRRRRPDGVSLPFPDQVASAAPGPDDLAEAAETRETILAAVRALPENERAAVTLFYMDGYSQKEIARFLEVPVSTINGRLRTSRRRLRSRVAAMVAQEFLQNGLGEDFADRTAAFHSGCGPLRWVALAGPDGGQATEGLSLEVDEVLGTSASIRPGERYIVRGRYELASPRPAWLGPVVNGRSRAHWEELRIGRGHFEVWIEVIAVGPQGAPLIGLQVCDADWQEIGVALDIRLQP